MNNLKTASPLISKLGRGWKINRLEDTEIGSYADLKTLNRLKGNLESVPSSSNDEYPGIGELLNYNIVCEGDEPLAKLPLAKNLYPTTYYGAQFKITSYNFTSQEVVYNFVAPTKFDPGIPTSVDVTQYQAYIGTSTTSSINPKEGLVFQWGALPAPPSGTYWKPEFDSGYYYSWLLFNSLPAGRLFELKLYADLSSTMEFTFQSNGKWDTQYNKITPYDHPDEMIYLRFGKTVDDVNNGFNFELDFTVLR